jgi:hypothetical protein
MSQKTRRKSAEVPPETEQEGLSLPLAVQVAMLEQSQKLALQTVFENTTRVQHLANTLHQIAAREDVPVEVKILIATTLEQSI